MATVTVSVSVGARARPHPSAAVGLALAAAAALSAGALGDLLLPSTYARETAAWADQGRAQDWFDLIALGPLTAAVALAAWSGGRRAQLALAGVLLCDVYTFVIYAFAIRFNPMFLVYCAGLGTSAYALAAQVGALRTADVAAWYRRPPPRRAVGGTLIGVGLAFALLWLSEDVPAIARGTAPASLDEVGLLTNPVHVLDLAIVLPLHLVAGVALWRGRPLGAWLAPLVLAFGVPMTLSIATLAAATGATGLALGMVGLAAVWVALLAATLRPITAPGGWSGRPSGR